jgi:hypothetical protein
MAAIQQLLFAIGQNQGVVSLTTTPLGFGATATSDGGSSAIAVLRLNVFNSGSLNVVSETNGTLTGSSVTEVNSQNWLTNGTAALYSVRIVTASDFTRSGGFISDLVNSWLPMSQGRSWTLAAVAGPLPRGGPQVSNVDINFTIQIARSDNLGNVLATSGNINFFCNAETSGESFVGGGASGGGGGANNDLPPPNVN